MKRYPRKRTGATKKLTTEVRVKRDPAWFGESAAHARAAKKGVRRKEAAKAVASEKSTRGWLTRYQNEVARIQAKRRPSKKDAETLRELRRKIREQKAILSRKRPPPARKPAVKRPAIKKRAVKKRARPRKLTRAEEQARARTARLRRERKEREAREAEAREEQLRLRRERERLRRIEREAQRRREEEEALRRSQQLIEIERLRAEAEARRFAEMERELEELRRGRETDLDRRRRATIEAAARIELLRIRYGGRVPPEGEMIGIAQDLELTVREIYAIFHGSPEIFAA